jgi:DNA-binding PadR family transcriptional regulator
MNQGLVDESRKKTPGDDPRRRYYQLMSLGRVVLEADIERLRNVIRHAKSRLKPAPHGAKG